MSYESFRTKLEDINSPEHKFLLKHVMKLVQTSRKEMARYYDQWDLNDAVFQSKRSPDKEDRTSEDRGQPKKIVLPLTFAQVMTFVAYNVTTVQQNSRFYKFEPTGKEDDVLTEPMELIIERDLRKNAWQAFLIQYFLDVGRFSIGIGEVTYEEQYVYMRTNQTETIQGAFGVETQSTTSAYEQIPTFIGNRVHSISPYRWLPDTRLPLTRFQEGEFCGSEDMFAFSTLQSDDNLFNLDKIPKFTKDEMAKRKANTRIVDMTVRENPSSNQSMTGDGANVSEGMVAITKMVVDITPKNFKCGEKSAPTLGKEPFKLRYIVWVANDKTIIRFEEAYYYHCKFPYFMSQMMPDQHHVVNQGLAEVCDPLASFITWKVNAHIQSQKNSVDSKWIVDPAGIEMSSLESRSPYIRLKKGAAQGGVDKYIKQFQTQDVTANVLQDTEGFKALLEAVTGYSGFMQGQSSQGRRSATQDRAVVIGATARGKTTLGGMWDTGFELLGRQLISNNRQEMDFDTFQRILGTNWSSLRTNPDTMLPYTLEELYAIFHADARTIAMTEDFFIFDASNPSENAFLAQSLQEMWTTIMTNPQVAMVMGYGPNEIKALEADIYELRGVTNARLPAPQPQQLQPGAAPNQIVPMPQPGVVAPTANV